MNEEPSELDPVDVAAEEFVERYRRGERPALSEYVRKYPEVADRIRAVFPTLVAMEELGSVDSTRRGSRAEHEASIPQQLGDYVILREIARGGMGIVYEAVQQSLGRHVALKVLPSATGHDVHRLERFQREARAAARLHHTNIVPVFGVGEHAGVHYFAMQFIHGQSLDNILAEVRRLRDCQTPDGANTADLATEIAGMLWGGSSATPPASDGAPGSTSSILTQRATAYYRNVAQVGVQVAEALEYAHQHGVLHRDIKPSNLILDTKGTVWVTDFGLAKEGGTEDLTRDGDIVGTLRYLAPERFRGHTDARSDVYSLGLTLYEMVTLRPAFSASERARLVEGILHEEPAPPRKLDAHVPRDLETIILKAIAKLPGKRYGGGAEIADDLRRFLADRPIRARRASPVERMWRLCRRNPLVSTLTALAAVLLLVTVGSIAWMVRDRSARRDKIKADVTEVLEAARRLLTENRPALAREKLAEANGLVSRNRVALGSLADSIDALTADLDEVRKFLDSTDQAFQLEFADSRLPALRGFPFFPEAVPFFLQAVASYEVLQTRPSVLAAGQWEQIRRAAYQNLLWLANDVLSRRQDHASGQPLSAQSAAEQALGYLQKAERAHPPTLVFYELRAHCRQALGEEVAAAADRELVRTTPPTVAWDHHLGGLRAYTASKFSEAGEAFKAALRLEPTAYWSLMYLGYCLCDHGQGRADLEAAMVAFTGCIMKRPEFAHGYFCRATAYTRLGKYTEALADYSRAIELNPNHFSTWYNRAVVHRRLGQWQEAVRANDKAIGLNPQSAAAWGDRGIAHAALGQFDKAFADFSKALQLDPKNAGANNAFSWFLANHPDAKKRDPQRAVQLARQAVALAPKNGNYWTTLGAAHYRAGAWQEALSALEKSIQLRRSATSFEFFFLAMAHKHLGHLEDASKYYDQAIGWMQKHQQDTGELRRLRAEAAALLNPG
jgi:serine/threonine protein kinase/Flp pilus assembly protein TadD